MRRILLGFTAMAVGLPAFGSNLHRFWRPPTLSVSSAGASPIPGRPWSWAMLGQQVRLRGFLRESQLVSLVPDQRGSIYGRG